MAKPLYLLAGLFAWSFHLQAQVDTLQPLVGGEPLTHVEDRPIFKGGQSAMYHFIYEHMRYPAEARSKGIQGNVVIKYVVDVDNSLKRIQVIKSVGEGCDEEALRIVQLMSDHKLWEPGRFNGKPVPVWYSLPIKFVLQ